MLVLQSNIYYMCFALRVAGRETACRNKLHAHTERILCYDTFAIINSMEEADKILEYLNKQHESIKFTMEKEENNAINFLDIKIQKKRDLSLITSTYRKPTFTGVFLNWNSLTSRRYKVGLLKCLLNRMKKICSNEEKTLIEMEQLRELMMKNNYPTNIITQEFDKFLKSNNTAKPNDTEEEKEKVKYLSLPYLNEKSEIIGTKISQLVKEHFHKVKLRVVFKAPAQLGDHFPFKDKVTDPMQQSNIVYHIKCKECDANYIGKTERICEIRFKEHEKQTNSALHNHHTNTKHQIDYENFEILDRASNDLKLCYKEMLYIRKLKPSLNTQENSELFTLIIRNAKLENSNTRDIEKYVKNNKTKARKV